MAGSIATATQGGSRHRGRGVIGTLVSLTTDASGDATATVTGVGFGELVSFEYSGGLDASAVITVKDYTTGATIFAYTTGTEGTPTKVRPSAVIADSAGVAVTAAAEAPNVNRDTYVAGKVTVTVASGGNAETASIKLIVDEAGISPQAYA